MLISPPFIPSPAAGETDQAFLDRAMQGGVPGDGGFPLSFDLNWHGGIHLTAPRPGQTALPVRAIADGTLAYFRSPTKEADADANHGLRYRDKWTDNGCIVLRHETEIGEGVQSKVVFYSIYMHLSKISLTNPSKGMVVYRKDPIGQAGSIYGDSDRVHFEIIADQSQIANLVGRSGRDLNHLPGNGRTDSCWGDMYFFIPPEVLIYESPPANLRQPLNSSPVVYRCPAMPAGAVPVQEGGSTENQTAPAPPPPVQGYEWAVASQLQEGIFVRMGYGKGQCKLTSFYVAGQEIGTHEEQTDYEYNLYAKASSIYPQSISAGYELLRFGRVLSDDVLQPADAAHWRQIKFPGRAGEECKTGWVNLNAPTVTKFSDADFPHWQGWQLINDDTDSDSHCQSAFIRGVLNLDADNTDAVSIALSPAYAGLSPEEKLKLSERYAAEREQNETKLKLAETQSRIKRFICKFPSEWCKNDFDTRYSWLLKVAQGGPLSEESYNRLRQHHQELAFWEDAALEGIETKHWHFPPKEFIAMLRKCGWLSSREFKQLIPRHALRKVSATQYAWEPVNINLEAPASVFVKHQTPLNKMMRKYGVNTPFRISCFMGNSIQETSWLARISEGNGSSLWYAPWYGRGFLQLTSPGNYIDYWRYRGRTVPETLRVALTTAYNQIYALPASQRSNAALQDANFSALTQEMRNWRSQVDGSGNTNEELFAPSDSAGFYWISKKMAKYADQPHVLERLSTTTTQGAKFYYRSPSFWKASAIVNLPSVLNTNYSSLLNGFDSRCCAYGYAVAVLSELKFPDSHGEHTLDFPEGYLPRRS